MARANSETRYSGVLLSNRRSLKIVAISLYLLGKIAFECGIAWKRAEAGFAGRQAKDYPDSTHTGTIFGFVKEQPLHGTEPCIFEVRLSSSRSYWHFRDKEAPNAKNSMVLANADISAF